MTNNTFKFKSKMPEIFNDSIKRISGEITIQLDSGYRKVKDVSYSLKPTDDGFSDFHYNEKTSELTLPDSLMDEFYAADFAQTTQKKLALPKLEGVSEKQASYAESVRSKNLSSLIASFFEDKVYFNGYGYSDDDYVSALNTITSASIWLDLLDNSLTHRGRNAHLLETVHGYKF